MCAEFNPETCQIGANMKFNVKILSALVFCLIGLIIYNLKLSNEIRTDLQHNCEFQVRELATMSADITIIKAHMQQVNEEITQLKSDNKMVEWMNIMKESPQ